MKGLGFIRNLGLVFRERKYVLIAAISSVLIAFVFAILAELIPVPSVSGGIRGIPFTFFDTLFMFTFPLLAGVTIAFYFYMSENRLKNRVKGVCATSGGVFLGLLTGVCPYCPIVLLLLIGMSITIDFLYPVFPYFRIMSLSLLLLSLYLVNKSVKIKKKEL